MSYSEFTLQRALTQFQLISNNRLRLFDEVAEIAPSPLLRATLEVNVPLAVAVGSEKARSEWIISPILTEIWRSAQPNISLFSGMDFTVDEAQGLNGICDFLFSRSPEQVIVRAPVVAIVEGKRDDIRPGLGQCIAAMVAAQRFNQEAGTGIEMVHGLVTTGSVWQFLRLDSDTVYFNQPEYYLEDLPKIIGILLSVVRE